MLGPVATTLLVLTAVPAAAFDQDVKPTVAGIRAERTRCQEAEPFPGPPELMECDGAAEDATAALTSLSSGTRALTDLLSDLFEPQEFTITGGEDTLAIRVSVSSSQAGFVLGRAEILTGQSAPATAGRAAASNPFKPLGKYARGALGPAALQQRWIAVRTADCAAYAVADCPARLDALMRDLVRTTQLTD